MTGRRWLQVALVGLGLSVTALVVFNWSEGTGRRPDDAGLEAPDDSDRLVSLSENLRLRKADRSGAQRYFVQADTLRSYRSGRRDWEGNVRLLLYSAPEGEEMRQEVTELTAGTLVERGPADAPDQIQLRDDVRIDLPGGARITTRRVRYEAVDEEVSTDAGVELEYAGLIFRARHLEYDRLASRLELRDGAPGTGTTRVSIESAARQDEGEPGPGVVGGADRLIFHGEDEAVRLEGLPDVEIAGAAVAGNVLVLETTQQRLEGLRAEREGAVVWSRSGRQHVLRAGVIDVELDDGEPSVVRGCAGAPRDDTLRGSSLVCDEKGVGRPSLALGGGGSLSGDRIDLYARPGGAASVVAGGEVSLDGSGARLGLERLAAGSLRLQLGAAGIEAAEATDGVELDAAGTPAAEPRSPARFTGSSLSLGWDEDELNRGTWSAGVRAELEDACAVAGRGEYLPDDGTWSLEEAPPADLRCDDRSTSRPQLTGDDYTVTADGVTLAGDGRLEASGDLELTLRGESLATVGAVFGTGTEVDGSAGTLTARGGRLELEEDVSLWQGRQLLQAGRLTLDPTGGVMSATGGVDVTLERDDRTLDLSGERMLVEGEPAVLRLTGEALLADDSRRMSGSTMVMVLGESGFESVEMQGGVEMRDPDGSAAGQELAWDVETGAVTVFGSQGRPATFRSPQGVQNRDPEGLEFRWGDDGLTIRALQKGTVQTLRSRRGGGSLRR